MSTSRSMGVRWLWPGPSGIFVPPLTSTGDGSLSVSGSLIECEPAAAVAGTAGG